MENKKRSDYLYKDSRWQKYFSSKSTLPLTPHAVAPYKCQQLKAAIAEDELVFWVKRELYVDALQAGAEQFVQDYSEAQKRYTFPESPPWNNLLKDSGLGIAKEQGKRSLSPRQQPQIEAKVGGQG